jgi:hypothetical protein
MPLETPSQVPVTTAPFAGGGIPGLDSGQVPGIPSQGGAPGPQTANPNDKAKQILAAIMQAASRKQVANTAVPAAIPAGGDVESARNIGMNTARPGAWSTQRFLATLGANIQNGVKATKEKQLLEAEGKWSTLQSYLNELYEAKASGDQQRIAAAQKNVDLFFRDDKTLKKMAKALNQDWMNPEKTDVWRQGLENTVKKQKQQDQQNAQKEKAASGLKQMFQHLIQKASGGPKPQLSDEEKQGIGREVQAKAPTVTPGMDPKALLDIEKASKDAREAYAVITSPNGEVWAYNKSNPKDAYRLKDSATGKEITGQTKSSQAPKVVSGKGGVPYAVTRGGLTVTPESPDWTKEDQTLFDGAMGSAKEAQQLKIDPIIADQVGAAPNPKDFPKGRSDPGYAKELKEYGQKSEQIKDRMASASGEARAKAFNEYRPVQAMDADGNVYWTTAKNAISGGMASASEGIKLKPREAQMKDIQVASKQTRDAINSLDKPFSPEQIAKLHLAITTPDDSVANAELTTLATQNLTEKQQDFVVWVKQLNERAMSLRNVAGMGTGAQDLRNAIRDMIPGVRSGNKQMMNKQLDAFDNQVKILKSGIAHPGKDTGTETQEYQGHTYQRKKGSNDPWALKPAAAN